jgi:sulfide:quinone oxidoreductase
MSTASKPRIVVLGAGFGGLELTTLLSEGHRQVKGALS